MIDDSGVGHYPPDAALIADWPHNPYTRGSYCTFSPAQDPLVGYVEIEGITIQRLFKPAGTIYFAGEAASVTAASGSVGAAFESAEIAAQLIMQRTKK
jgi:monoamine oxidase